MASGPPICPYCAKESGPGHAPCPQMPEIVSDGAGGSVYIPHQPHSPTSIAAAEDAEVFAGSCLRAVFDDFRTRGSYGATDEEQQDGLDMNPSTQRPRRIELVQRGLVHDSGRTRPTRSGRAAVVWVAKVTHAQVKTA